MARVSESDPFDVPECPECGSRMWVSGSSGFHWDWRCDGPGCGTTFGPRNVDKDHPAANVPSHWTRASLIRSLRTWRDDHGRYPSRSEINDADTLAPYDVYRREFRGITEALRLARERDAEVGGGD